MAGDYARFVQEGHEVIVSGKLEQLRTRYQMSYRALAVAIGTNIQTAQAWCLHPSPRIRADSCAKVGRFAHNAAQDEAALLYLGLSWEQVVPASMVAMHAGAGLAEVRRRASATGVEVITLLAAGDVYRRTDLSDLGVTVSV
jgi:hypothetical protein